MSASSTQVRRVNSSYHSTRDRSPGAIWLAPDYPAPPYSPYSSYSRYSPYTPTSLIILFPIYSSNKYRKLIVYAIREKRLGDPRKGERETTAYTLMIRSFAFYGHMFSSQVMLRPGRDGIIRLPRLVPCAHKCISHLPANSSGYIHSGIETSYTGYTSCSPFSSPPTMRPADVEWDSHQNQTEARRMACAAMPQITDS